MIPRDHPLIERILALVPINSLDPRLQDQALAQGELLEFKKKKIVFEAGARDPYTFYLLDGELELRAGGASPLRMRTGDENARRALAQLQPRRYTAIALSAVTMFRIERAVLDHILADEQMIEEQGGVMEVEEIDESEDQDSDWMTRLLSSELFIRLPNENIQRFFAELEPMEAEQGEVVVEQGTPGDYLYIVAEGRATVVRRAPGGGQQLQLAVLKEGDTFGEESLISNSPRNASVKMVTEGMLMRLPKRAFEELVSNPTLKAVAWSEATQLADKGARWLDVRFPDEHAAKAIEGSVNAPLNALRLQASKLPIDKTYIVYCDTGARSSAGAFLLARMGFDVRYLAGGLERSPLGEAGAGTPAAEAAAEETPAASFEFEFVTADSEDAGPDTDETMGADTVVELITAREPAPPAAAAAEPAAPPAPAQQPAPKPEPAAAPAAAPADSAQVRAALASLKAERDNAAAYGNKAVRAAHELKRRNEELLQRLKEERDQREALDKELAAARADAQRQASLEKTRLEGELDKATRRLEAVQRDSAAEREKAAGELARLNAGVSQAAEKLKAVQAQKEEAESKRVAAEAAFQDALAEAQKLTGSLREKLDTTEGELKAARERLEETESRHQQAVQSREEDVSHVKRAVEEARAQLKAEIENLEQEKTRLNEELASMMSARREEEDRLRDARAELEKEQAAVRARAEELDGREVDLGNARATVEQELAARDEALKQRETDLGKVEADLSKEKAAWNETVEQAIAGERDRLESAYAKYREEVEAEAMQRAEALAQERTGELRAEQESREAQMRSQVEAHVAKLLAEFDERLAQVRNGYEVRLTEQEAMLEDERRRLETEIVRLREALESARSSATAPAPAPARAAARRDARAEEAGIGTDLELQLDEVKSRARTRGAEPDTVPELDLAIEASEPPGGPPAEPQPAESQPAAPESDDAVPVISLAENEAEAENGDAPPGKDERARVISSAQLAAIRRKMQEKMTAAKARAG